MNSLKNKLTGRFYLNNVAIFGSCGPDIINFWVVPEVPSDLHAEQYIFINRPFADVMDD